MAANFACLNARIQTQAPSEASASRGPTQIVGYNFIHYESNAKLVTDREPVERLRLGSNSGDNAADASGLTTAATKSKNPGHLGGTISPARH